MAKVELAAFTYQKFCLCQEFL